MYIQEQAVKSLSETEKMIDFLKQSKYLWSILKMDVEIKKEGNWCYSGVSIIGVPFSEALKNIIEGKRIAKSMFYIDEDVSKKGLEGRLLAYYNRRDFEIDFQLWEIIPDLPTYYVHGIYNLKEKEFSHFDGALIMIDENTKDKMKWKYLLPEKDYLYRKLFRLDGKITIEEAMEMMYYYLPLEDLNNEYGACPLVKEKSKYRE